jgi:hypothetical protein
MYINGSIAARLPLCHPDQRERSIHCKVAALPVYRFLAMLEMTRFVFISSIPLT